MREDLTSDKRFKNAKSRGVFTEVCLTLRGECSRSAENDFLDGNNQEEANRRMNGDNERKEISDGYDHSSRCGTHVIGNAAFQPNPGGF